MCSKHRQKLSWIVVVFYDWQTYDKPLYYTQQHEYIRWFVIMTSVPSSWAISWTREYKIQKKKGVIILKNLKALVVLLMSLLVFSACSEPPKPVETDIETEPPIKEATLEHSAEEDAAKAEAEKKAAEEDAAKAEAEKKAAEDAAKAEAEKKAAEEATKAEAEKKAAEDAAKAEAEKKAAETDIWKQIESSYYLSSSQGNSMLNTIDASFLQSGNLSSHTIAPTRSSINLNSHEGIETFIQNINETGLKASLLDTNTFLGLVEDDSNSVSSTALIKNGVLSQVMTGDQGKFYLFHLSSQDKELLSSSGLNCNQTTASFVFFDGFATGIVFDDGSNQMVKVYSSYQDIIPSSTILSLNKFLDTLKNSEELLTEGTQENQNLDPSKPDVTVG